MPHAIHNLARLAGSIVAALALCVIGLATAIPAKAAPAVPTITSPTDGEAVSTLAISGTATPGSLVNIYIDDALIIGINATAGDWSFNSSTYPDGVHRLKVTATDGSGTSDFSPEVTFYLYSSLPPAPTITSPTAGAIVGTTTVTVTGTGQPGSTVMMSVNTEPYVAQGRVSASGTWSTTLTGLPEGPNTLLVYLVNAVGGGSATSRSYTIDTPPSPPVVNPSGATTDTTPTLTGTGEPGTQIRIATTSGQQVCEATVSADGTWTCTLTTALTVGTHTLRVTATDNRDQTSAATTTSITILGPTPTGSGSASTTPSSSRTTTSRSGDGSLADTGGPSPAAGLVLVTASLVLLAMARRLRRA